DPRARAWPDGRAGRAQDEGRHEDLRPHHGAASGSGAGRGRARRDPRQPAGAADLPRRDRMKPAGPRGLSSAGFAGVIPWGEVRVLPNLTVLENLRLALLGARRNGGGRLEEVLDFFPALRERIAHKGRFLSGGEQQMLAIARGLIAEPSLMLVDEPTEGLSPL